MGMAWLGLVGRDEGEGGGSEGTDDAATDFLVNTRGHSGPEAAR